MPRGGRAVWGGALLGGQVDAAYPQDGIGLARAAQGSVALPARRPSRLAAGAVASEPHVTLHRPAAELAERGRPVSHNAVWLWLRRNGQIHKKRPARPSQRRADVQRRRRSWKRWLGWLDPAHLVFLDETWIKTYMAPLRGGGRRVSAFGAKRPMAIGAPRPSSRRCATIGSKRPACPTGQSTAPPSWLGSSGSLSPP